MNKMIHNKDLKIVKEVLDKVKDSKICGIMFYDLGIFNICNSMNIDKELILSQEHLNASQSSNEFYYNRGIKNSFITSDITYNELNEINNNTNMNIYYTVYGYLPIFYSRRYLLSNYFKYIEKDMNDDKYYIFNPESKIVYTRFTAKDCKTCIDKIIEGGN
jgi:putative protease